MNFQGKPKRYLIIILKVIGWAVISVFGLLIILSLAIQIPYVQNKLTQSAINFVEDKIGTDVNLERISLSIPKKIVLTGLYLEDQKRDTLLYAGELAINTDLWKLTKQTIQLNDIELSDFQASVSRSKRDSSFNFDYIVKAFAGDSSAAPDTTKAAWKFSVGNVVLENIRLLFSDQLMGNDVSLRVGALDLAMEELDLEKSIYKVDEIRLDNVNANIVQSKVEPDTVVIVPDSASQEIALDIGLNKIEVNNIKALYNHQGTGQVLSLDLGTLIVEGDNMDLKNRSIDLSTISLQNTFLTFHQMAGFQKPQSVADTSNTDSSGDTWHIKLAALDLDNNSIQYHDFDKPFLRSQFDSNHIWITNLSTKASDLQWSGNTAQAELENFSFKDKSGVAIESFSVSLLLNDSVAEVRDLHLKSSNSKIDLNAKAKYPSLKNISETYQDAVVDLNFNESIIGLRDVQLFAAPILDSLPINLPADMTISIDTEIQGALRELAIKHLQVSTLRETVLNGSGIVRLVNNQSPAMSIDLNKFYTTKSDINTILPDTLIPSSIELPDWISLSGKINGTVQSPSVNTIVRTSIGQIDLVADLDRNERTGSSRYNGSLNVTQLQTGKLLKNEEMYGPLTLSLKVNGSGLSMEDLNTIVDLDIKSFTYQGYHYQDFRMDGSLKKYFFSGSAEIADKNLDLTLEGDLDYNEDIPKYQLELDLKNADFQALNFSQRPLKARGKLEVDLATSDFKLINGDLGIRKFAIFNGEDMYAVDSLLFASIDQKGKSEIKLRSDIIDGNFAGTINLYSLPEVIKRHFNQYFSLQDTAFDKPVGPQDFEFDLTIKDTDLITEILIPELDPFTPGEITGQFDSQAEKMDLRIGLSNIRYSGIGTDSITFNLTSDKQRLDYLLSVRKIAKDSLGLEALQLRGHLANDSIRTKLVILDSLQKDKYVLGGVFYSLEDVFQFKFLQDEVVMNYAPWTVPGDNSIQFTSAGLRANNFSITNINEMIGLETSNDADSIVSILFKDLNLQNISNLVEGVTPFDGLANGNVNLMSSKSGAFNTRLTVERLKILDQTWGDLALALGQTANGPLNIDLRLESDQTELKAAGYYTADATSPEISFLTEIQKFDLASIEPLTIGQLKNVKGQLQGRVNIQGNPQKPDIDGELKFIQASFTPSAVNTEFVLEDEIITVQNDKILLPDFTITDRQKNVARISGEITSNEFQDFKLKLNLNANNFQILNSTEKDNELFYGKVKLSTNAKITGDINQPVIDMNINLSDDSEFTYVIPDSEKGVLEQEGIVRWVDRDAKNDPFLASIKPADTIKSTFRGIDLSANIELSDKETFNIVIDPATGDKLSVKGNSTLTLDIDPTGDMVLSGRYEISEGSYDLSFYKFVKRKFLIEKGSTIIWSGSPIDADMNIRAIYEVETSPMDLFVGTQEGELPNTYKQRLPFVVYLQIREEMLTPEISFQLDMPESNRNALGGVVYAKIRDINTRESDLNKQVFALLVLKRFISDNPLESEAGSDAEGVARRSVSKLLSEQLNRLSQNVEGVELSFDVKSYEDYSSGNGEGQTQLQLGLSKSLLDDRLVVKVSGNLEVEGNASRQNSASDYIGDLALEYKLTEDGRFRITGFRQSNFDMISGELIETGVGLIYIKDYNTLRELFKANEKDK